MEIRKPISQDRLLNGRGSISGVPKRTLDSMVPERGGSWKDDAEQTTQVLKIVFCGCRFREQDLTR